MPSNQIKNELLEPNTPKWRLFKKQLPASNFWPNERVHVSVSESRCTETATKMLLENSAGVWRNFPFAPAPEFYCVKSLPPLMRAVAEASRQPGEESCQRASLCQQEWNAPMVFICFHITNMSTDSIFFQSFKNSFLCFHPLYLLCCFVSERANGTDFQAMRAWCNPQIQHTARSMYHPFYAVSYPGCPFRLELNVINVSQWTDWQRNQKSTREKGKTTHIFSVVTR